MEARYVSIVPTPRYFLDLISCRSGCPVRTNAGAYVRTGGGARRVSGRLGHRTGTQPVGVGLRTGLRASVRESLPVRQVIDRIAGLDLDWVHAMHGGTLTKDALPHDVSAFRTQEFAYRGMLLGREVATPAPQ